MWSLSSWRPKLILNRQGLAELFSFSLNLVGARIAGFFNNNMGEILVGKFLGTTALGIFASASNSTSIFRARIAASITEVTFPAFSSIHQDDERMRRGYQKVARYVSLMTFPALTGLAIIAPEFIALVYGPKWAQAVLPLQILCIGVAFSTLGIINGPVQKAKGRTDHYLNLTIISLIVTILFMLIGVNYGLVGVATALSIRSALLLWGVNFFTHRLIDLPLKVYLKALYPATICSVIMGVSMFFYHLYALQIFNHNPFAVLVTSVLLGAGIFFLTLKIMNEESLKEGLGIFWNIAGPGFANIQKKLFGSKALLK
jgi:O-antigen/teichoic acid export membrane protein